MRILILAVVSCLLLIAGSRPLQAYALEGFKWPDGQITMNLQLSGGFPLPSGGGIEDGSTEWNQVAEAALADWNPYLNKVQFTYNTTTLTPSQGDFKNSVFFSSTIFGDTFGEDTLAVTASLTDGSNTVTTESDVVVNTADQWNSYRGNLQSFGSTFVYDLRRVLDHEFGHVLGLAHPDQASPAQNVVAIMNSIIGDLDHIAQDDIDGVLNIYGSDFASLYFQNGTQLGVLSVNNSFAPTIWHGVGFVGSGWTQRAVADINGDSIPDIFFQNGTTIGVMIMNADDTENHFIVIGGMNAGWQLLGAADINNDGQPELIFQNQTLLGFLTVNRQGAPLAWQGIGGMNTGWELRAIADLNSDGQPDFIFQNGTLLGALEIGTNGLPVAWHGIGQLGTGWTLGFATDINGDNHSDLIFQNGGTLGALETNTSFLPVAWHGIGYLNGWVLPGDFF